LKICNYFMVSIFGLLLLIIAGCGETPANSESETKRVEKVVPVAIEVVKAEDVVDFFVLPASLEAQDDIVIAAETTGPVHHIRYEEGDAVSEGDILLEIDPDTIKSSLRRDQDNVSVIERKLTRFQSLVQEGLVSKQEIEDLENSLVAARESLKRTQLQLTKSQPRSPITGHVDHLYIDRGEYVDPGKPLVRLLKVDQLKVIADIPEKDIAYLSVGQQVKITPAKIHAKLVAPVTGKIGFIAYAANDVTRTYRTKIMINNPGYLRPGMIVRAEFVRQSLTDVVTVPLYALIDKDDDKFVYVFDNGLARLVPIVIGSSIGQRIVVLEGLSVGDHVVVKGQQLLSDGIRISEGTL
jgi:RND family efflux transporter MFP subunit